VKADLKRISERKRDFRRWLAAQPVAEKLRLLDALRDRALAIRGAAESNRTAKAIVEETPRN
jgi:hypothetical protein